MDSLALLSKTLFRSSHHQGALPDPGTATREEGDALIAKPLNAATGEREERNSGSNRELLGQMLSVGRTTEFERLLSAEEAAGLLGNIHVKTLQRYARQGSVPGYRIGGRWYFRTTELDAWLQSRLNSNCQSVR